jgi:antitoxin HigA-1
MMSIQRPKGGWKVQRTTTHPGEMLREEFLKPLGLSANQLALDLHVPATRIGQILKGKRGITADTALRLARYFGTSPGFWMNLQKNYELSSTREQTGKAIEEAVRPRAVSAA